MKQNKQLTETRVTKIPWWVARSVKDAKNRIFWVTGGLGSGKTTGAAIWFIDRWLLNRKSQFSWAIAPTHTKIEQILLPAVRQVLFDIYGLVEDVNYRIYKGRFFKLILKGYPHEIHFLSGDRPGMFVGSNIAGLWVTEPGLMTREVFEKSQARLRCPRAELRQTMFEGTPEGLSGKGAWYSEMGDIPGVGFDRVDAKRAARRLIVETTMNKHLVPSPEEYAQTQIRDVYAYDPSKILSYEKGLFVPFTKGSAYWEFVESRNVVGGDFEFQPERPILLTWDFNVSPLAWVAGQKTWVQKNYYEARQEKIVFAKESSGDSRGLMDGVAEFVAKFPLSTYRNTEIQIYGDASGWARDLHSASSSYSLIENYLRQIGYRKVEVYALRSNPLVKDRLEKVAAIMCYERMAVHYSCKNTISSFVKTSLKEGTWDIEKPGTRDTWTHYGDAVGYCLYTIYKDSDVLGIK